MSGRGGSGPHVSSGFRSAPGGARFGGPGGAGFARPGGAGFVGNGGARFAGPGGARFAGPGGFRSGPGFRTFGPSRPGLSAFGPSRNGFSSRRHGFVNFNGRFGGRFGSRRFGSRRFHRFHDRDFFFDDCFGCRSRFFFDPFFNPFFFDSGLFFGVPFYPYYPGFYGNDYGPPAQQQEPAVVNPDNGASAQLSAEVQRLSDEVDDLRNEESRRYAEQRAAAANSGASISAKQPAVTTVFIFQDGRRISTQSYAIAGQTLWIFNEHTARKFQVADLNASATEKANAANGVEFHIPEPSGKH
jgi:hypothetical protein